MTRDEAVSSIATMELRHEPGSDYAYNNTNYTVLALVIEAVTAQGYRQYVVDEILHDRDGRPLGAGWWDGTPATGGPRAWGRVGVVPAPQRGDAPGPHWAMNGNGAMAMTPLQLAEWTAAFFTGRILTPEATELFLSTWTALGGFREVSGWGWDHRGTVTGQPIYQSSGAGSGIGHRMDAYWLPESGRVIVIAENAVDHDLGSVVEQVTPALVTGTGVPLPPAVEPTDPALVARAVGRYAVGDDGTIAVVENSGGITVRVDGVDAALAFLAPGPDRAEEVADHEAAVRRHFDQGLTGQAGRNLARQEELDGPLGGVEVDATIDDGGTLVSLLTLELATRTRPGVAVVDVTGELSFAVPDEAESGRTFFYVPAPAESADGAGFVDRFPPERGPRIVVRVTDGGLTIENPETGVTVTARRVA